MPIPLTQPCNEGRNPNFTTAATVETAQSRTTTRLEMDTLIAYILVCGIYIATVDR